MTTCVVFEATIDARDVAIGIDSPTVETTSAESTVSLDTLVDGHTAAVEVESPTASATTSDPVVVFGVSPGPRGEQGDAGDGSPIFDETPTGAQDGTNAVFTTANTYRPNSVLAYRNGLREQRGIGFLETGPGEITFTTPPLDDDILSIDYLIA